MRCFTAVILSKILIRFKKSRLVKLWKLSVKYLLEFLIKTVKMLRVICLIFNENKSSCLDAIVTLQEIRDSKFFTLPIEIVEFAFELNELKMQSATLFERVKLDWLLRIVIKL